MQFRDEHRRKKPNAHHAEISLPEGRVLHLCIYLHDTRLDVSALAAESWLDTALQGKATGWVVLLRKPEISHSNHAVNQTFKTAACSWGVIIWSLINVSRCGQRYKTVR